MKNKKYFLLFILISILYLSLRLWNLNNLITFHLDQGLQLGEAYQMIQNHHLNLIGPMVTTKTFEGRAFFIGPFYTYVLAILGLVTKWNPLAITILLVIIEYFALALFLFWISKKSSTASLLMFFLVSVTPFLIEHSRFYWNPHFLLPLSFLLIYFLEHKKYFYSAIIWGLAFSFHYSAILWIFPILLYLIKNHENFKKYLIYIPGFLLGDLPWFLFEIKHNFYNIKTIFLVFTNTNKAGELSAYYFVFPFTAFFILYMVYLYKKSKKYFYIIFISVISFNIFYKFKLQEKIPIGMPTGWTYPTQKEITKLILQNGCPKYFNIATTIGDDTRSYDLRYLLTIKKCPPDSVDNYPKDKTIFLIAPPSRPPETENVWEISSFKPFKVTEQIKINDAVIFYRLDKY